MGYMADNTSLEIHDQAGLMPTSSFYQNISGKVMVRRCSRQLWTPGGTCRESDAAAS